MLSVPEMLGKVCSTRAVGRTGPSESLPDGGAHSRRHQGGAQGVATKGRSVSAHAPGRASPGLGLQEADYNLLKGHVLHTRDTDFHAEAASDPLPEPYLSPGNRGDGRAPTPREMA